MASLKTFSHRRCWRLGAALLVAACVAGCGSSPKAPPQPGASPAPAVGAGAAPSHPRSRWVPVDWSELPGFESDDTSAAWNAWLQSCERPPSALARLCPQVRQLALAGDAERRAWMRANLRPYRVQATNGERQGLLTSYYEPLFDAARQRQPGFEVPLYAPPAGLRQGARWYTRQQIDQSALLAGRELVWLRDAVGAMIVQIQGSGRVRVREAGGGQRTVRMAFAGTNGQPFRSPARWLVQQGATRDASWPGVRAALAARPHLVQPFMWSNPRVVFFKEEAISAADASAGPRGAQGVPLTAGRSIAVDPKSIPYGTPVWLVSSGPAASLQRLVLAQDTGSAITGAVRADFFAGTGEAAGTLAGSIKQPLYLWVLWPK